MREVEARAGIKAYGDSSGDLFSAVGDENGFFIVVKRDRLWLPDMRVAAHESPLAVRFSENEGTDFWMEGPPYRFRPA